MTTTLPKWVNHFDNSFLKLQLPEYHYFSSSIEGYRPITLYNLGRTVKMHIEVDMSVLDAASTHRLDQSAIKDFSNRDNMQAIEAQAIIINQSTLNRQSQWVNKYEPSKFSHLLTDEKNNRVVLSWLKSWDTIVFNKQPNIAKSMQSHNIPNFFNNYNHNKHINTTQPTYNQQINHQKLILLAGPPGCGKTTLARVVATHCKYQYTQINASDDRNANSLIQKIANMASNETIRSNKMPTLIIIDEVDGAMDSQTNGLKDVINYIETGNLPNHIKKEKKKNKEKDTKITQEADKNMFIKRPIIFICNDPYAKGLKDLRAKAKIIYFNQLETERVVKRLKEVCEQEHIFIDKQILNKIAQLCSNDIRSSLGVLELTCRMKKTLNIQPKQFLTRLKLSLNKDSQQTINELIWDVLHKKVQSQNPNHFFSEMEYRVMKIDKQSLLMQTFFQNLHRSKNTKSFGVNFGKMSQMYNCLTYCDFIFSKGFNYDGELDRYLSFPLSLYQLYFKTDDFDRIQFPRSFIDNLNRYKANQATIQQLRSKMDHKLLPLISRSNIKIQDIWTLFISIQPNSLKDEEIIKCLSLMITYGLEFAENHSNSFNKKIDHLYKPDIENLFVYTNPHNKHPYFLNNSSKALMESSYAFIKSRLQILNHPQYEGKIIKEPTQILLNKMNLNCRKRNPQGKGKIRYKYQEGSGTQIKCTLKLKYFA